DARIGVGEKCEAGTKPSGVRAVVESLNFRGVGRNEVIVEARVVVLHDRNGLARIACSRSEIWAEQRQRDIEPRIVVARTGHAAGCVPAKERAAHLVVSSRIEEGREGAAAAAILG